MFWARICGDELDLSPENPTESWGFDGFLLHLLSLLLRASGVSLRM